MATGQLIGRIGEPSESGSVAASGGHADQSDSPGGFGVLQANEGVTYEYVGKFGGGGGSFQNVTLPQKTASGQWVMSDWWTSPVNNTGKVQYWQLQISASNSSGSIHPTSPPAFNQRLLAYSGNSGSFTFCATLWPGYSFGIGVSSNDSDSVTMNGTAYYMELPEI